MSHERVRQFSIPVVLEHGELTGKLEPVSRRSYLADRDSSQFRFVPEHRNPQAPFDPWKLRDDFLSWPPEHWEGFVEMAGNLGAFRVSQQDFNEWQRLLKEALVCPTRSWSKLESRFDRRKVRQLWEPLPITFDWTSRVPIARIKPFSALKTIVATIQLDRLRGAQFKFCARNDCRRVFELESHPNRIYCDYECAHLVAVRNSRRRKSEETTKFRRKEAR